jgi:hypothetical protein
VALAVVRDLRDLRPQESEKDLAALETDLLSEFVLARYSAGLVDSSIRNDITNLELVREWFGRPLWELRPTDVDRYFGKKLRHHAATTRACGCHRPRPRSSSCSAAGART